MDQFRNPEGSHQNLGSDPNNRPACPTRGFLCYITKAQRSERQEEMIVTQEKDSWVSTDGVGGGLTTFSKGMVDG